MYTARTEECVDAGGEPSSWHGMAAAGEGEGGGVCDMSGMLCGSSSMTQLKLSMCAGSHVLDNPEAPAACAAPFTAIVKSANRKVGLGTGRREWPLSDAQQTPTFVRRMCSPRGRASYIPGASCILNASCIIVQSLIPPAPHIPRAHCTSLHHANHATCFIVMHRACIMHHA